MHELWRSDDLVEISLIEAILSESEIDFVVLDAFASSAMPGFNVIPRRIMVLEEDLAQARRHLRAAGLVRPQTP